MRILTILADGFEETEMIAVVDLLKRGGVDVVLASINEEIVTGGHGVKIVSDCLLSEADFNTFDGVFLPGGGAGVDNLSANAGVISIIRSFNESGKWIIAICAAPALLDIAGIIKGRNVTVYPSCKDKVPSAHYSEEKVVVDNKIVTSRGLGTSIDLGLKLLELFKGREMSLKIKSSVIY